MNLQLFPTSLGNDENLVKQLGQYRQLRRRLVLLAKLAYPEINTQTVQIMIMPDGIYSVRVPILKPLSVDKLFGEADPIGPPIDTKDYEIKRWRGKGRRTRTEYEAAFAYSKDNDAIYVRSFRYYPGRERGLVWRSYYA